MHLYQVRFFREVLKVNNVGPNPPAILSLSDGGRLEKYGLLYLLKKRLKKILIVDGSLIAQDASYSKSILKSMDKARELLHCEFVGFDGRRDVKEQMRKEYVEAPEGPGKPRHFRFLVQYFKEEEDGTYSMDGTGEVMIIAPRHPDNGVTPRDEMGVTWADYGEDLDAVFGFPKHFDAKSVFYALALHRISQRGISRMRGIKCRRVSCRPRSSRRSSR